MTVPHDDEHDAPIGDAGSMDWEDLRKKLSRFGALDDDTAEAAEERRRVLRERARILARPAEEACDEHHVIPILEFVLGDERYAIDATAVREVCRVKAITPVPSTREHVAGVMAVRGRIVAVVDLSALVSAPACEFGEDTMGVVLHADDMEFAVLADSVVGLSTVSDSSLQVDVSALSGARRTYLLGVTENRVAVLDAQRLLGDDTLIATQQGGVQITGGGS